MITNKFLTVLLLLSSTLMFAQNKVNIVGKIVDENNMPLKGASIVLKGTSIGAASDSKGEYHIAFEYSPGLDSNQLVIIYFLIGYNLKEEKLDLNNREAYARNVTLVKVKRKKKRKRFVEYPRDVN